MSLYFFFLWYSSSFSVLMIFGYNLMVIKHVRILFSKKFDSFQWGMDKSHSFCSRYGHKKVKKWKMWNVVNKINILPLTILWERSFKKGCLDLPGNFPRQLKCSKSWTGIGNFATLISSFEVVSQPQPRYQSFLLKHFLILR